MRTILFFLLFFLRIEPLEAASYSCQKLLNSADFVRIRYNYGELGFDVSKNIKEVGQVCKDNAAGCFLGSSGTHKLSVQDKIMQIRHEKCVAPLIDISYDFSGSKLYIPNDYTPCSTRAVLRHELQHFMIWKTSKEWFLKDLQYSLQQIVQKRTISCSRSGKCLTDSMNEVVAEIVRVENRWIRIERQNHELLDEIDHSVIDEVNYTVCAPYSLKVGLF